MLVLRSYEDYTVKRRLFILLMVSGFPHWPILCSIFLSGFPALQNSTGQGHSHRRTRTSPTTTCRVRPESHSVLTWFPSLPSTEQRRLREHLELVILHPSHHHRLLFYAEPRAGCAVRVSLCSFTILFSLSSSPKEEAIETLF